MWVTKNQGWPTIAGKNRGWSHSNGYRRQRGGSLVTHAQWLENSAEVEVAAPLQKCWELWEDQERIPSWMPWISSVKAR